VLDLNKTFISILVFLSTYKYGGVQMSFKQISLTMPENLLKASQEYIKDFGYKNVQELILELIRNKVIIQKIERYQQIESEMINNTKIKEYNQKEALNFINNL